MAINKPGGDKDKSPREIRSRQQIIAVVFFLLLAAGSACASIGAQESGLRFFGILAGLVAATSSLAAIFALVYFSPGKAD